MVKLGRAALVALLSDCVPALAVPATSSAAGSVFLKSDALTGESVQVGHVGAIEVADWSWGASRSGGKATVDELSITKAVDLSSTQLFANLTSGGDRVGG